MILKVDAKAMMEFHKKIDKPFEVTVNGESMQPTLYNGDIVRISCDKEYKIGDIVLFKYRDEGDLLHRIISIENNVYSCKGDNALRIEYILFRHIIGKVVSVYRNECIFYI